MLLRVRTVLHSLAKPFVRWYQRRELLAVSASQHFRRTNERPVEYAFAFHQLNACQPRSVLDVGSGRSAFPALLRTCGFVVTATDNIRDYWPDGMLNRHWYVVDDDIAETRLEPASFDAVTCISVLEHVSRPLEAIMGMQRVLKPGGALILTTPFGQVGHSNVYTLPGSYGARNPYPCRQSSMQDLNQWLATGFTLQEAEYWECFLESQYWSCGALRRPPARSTEPAHLGCFALVKRGEGEECR